MGPHVEQALRKSWTEVQAAPEVLLDIFVPGRPRPAGSKRALPVGGRSGARRVILVDASGQAGVDWRVSVQGLAREAWGPHELLAEPCALWCTFYRLRPQKHFKRGELRADASAFPVDAPDALKLGRAVEDALTGVVYVDDRYVVENHCAKRYGERPGARVVVTRGVFPLEPRGLFPTPMLEGW